MISIDLKQLLDKLSSKYRIHYLCIPQTINSVDPPDSYEYIFTFPNDVISFKLKLIEDYEVVFGIDKTDIEIEYFPLNTNTEKLKALNELKFLIENIFLKKFYIEEWLLPLKKKTFYLGYEGQIPKSMQYLFRKSVYTIIFGKLVAIRSSK